MRLAISVSIAAAICAPRIASADEPVEGDGYCDYVEGVASAVADLKYMPVIFGEFGYIEQSATSTSTTTVNSSLRALGGIRYQLTGPWEGSVTKDRAHADCRRHKALEQIRGETEYAALDAKVKVLDPAIAEADKLMQTVDADLRDRRTTTQEATALRLRVEELRQLSADAHRQMTTLQAPQQGSSLAGALHAFQKADDEVEEHEGRLRFIQAFDISVRAGVDEFLDRTDNPSPFFAVVSVGVNIGALFQNSANARAARGRAKLVRSGHDPLAVDATVERLKAVVDSEAVRLEQTATLEADLKRQLDALDRVGGDESKRYRQTVWFDWIKIRAEHAYLEAHLAALKQVLGG